MNRQPVNGRQGIRSTKPLTALGETPAEMLLDMSSTLIVSTIDFHAQREFKERATAVRFTVLVALERCGS